MLQAAKEKKQESLRKGWRFGTVNGIVIIRDVLDRFIFSVHRFKAVGGVPGQASSLQASLPWTAMQSLLRMPTNDALLFGDMVNDMEKIVHILTRSQKVAQQYLETNASAPHQS